MEHHAEVDSTNRLLAARAADGEPAGLVVVADHQTAGRGRLDRGWEDRPGDSLLCSALVDADGLAATLIPLAAGLAVVDAARDVGVDAVLKWPNDVLVPVGSPPHRQKCAGILVEGVHHEGRGRAVVGVGINVDWRSAPDTRASLVASAGRAVDRFAVLDRLLVHLDRRLVQLRDDPEGCRDDYRGVCTTLGREVRAETPGGPVTGTAVDVDEGGALRLETSEGEVVLLQAGDVTHLRPLDGPG